MLISGIRLKVTHCSKELLERVKKQSGMHECSYRIIKKATDACHSDICYVYTIEAVKKVKISKHIRALSRRRGCRIRRRNNVSCG